MAAVDARSPLPFYGSPVSARTARPSRAIGRVDLHRLGWGRRRPAKVALTFDDGPHPDWTPRVLAALAAAEVPATFFCLGENVRDHGDLHRDSVGRHELANHTYTHPELGRLGAAACRDEIDRTSQVMERTYGIAPTLFRPPYGHVGGAAVLAAAEAGLTTVLWSAQSARTSSPPPQTVSSPTSSASCARAASSSPTTPGSRAGSSPSTGSLAGGCGPGRGHTPSRRCPTSSA